MSLKDQPFLFGASVGGIFALCAAGSSVVGAMVGIGKAAGLTLFTVGNAVAPIFSDRYGDTVFNNVHESKSPLALVVGFAVGAGLGIGMVADSVKSFPDSANDRPFLSNHQKDSPSSEGQNTYKSTSGDIVAPKGLEII